MQKLSFLWKYAFIVFNDVANICIFTALSLFSFCTVSLAETQTTFRLTNNTEKMLAIKFYSQDYDAVWPAGDQAYQLEASQKQSFDLICHQGEKICFGAVTYPVRDGSYLGIGDGTKSCTNCCQQCGQSLAFSLGVPQNVSQPKKSDDELNRRICDDHLKSELVYCGSHCEYAQQGYIHCMKTFHIFPY